MYISRQNAKTQGLRKAFVNAQETDRHYNIKSLRTIDKDLARKYTDARYYGGSLKSFWNKVKKFGKHIINSAITTTRNMYRGPKKLIDFVSKNDSVKKIISGVGNAVGSSVGVPGLGNMITTGIDTASNITDSLENVVKNIQNKNPELAVSDIKNIVGKVKNTTEEISKNLPEDQRKKVETKVNEIYSKLPKVIKSEGAANVEKAAGYLPLIDISSVKQKMLKGKGKQGGMVPKWRVVKPKNANEISSKLKLPSYNADIVGNVAGAIWGKGKLTLGEDLETSKKKKESENGGRLYMAGKKEAENKTSDLYERIRSKLKK